MAATRSLKERAFGLTNSQGNHGEDVKEYYFYLDSTPTHSYMKYLYKYPQAPFPTPTSCGQSATQPIRDGVRARRHGRLRRGPLLRRLRRVREGFARTCSSRSRPGTAAPSPRSCTCSRRSGFATSGHGRPTPRGELHRLEAGGRSAVAASHPALGQMFLYCDRDVPLLVTENETNLERVFWAPNASPYVKDAFHEYVVAGRREAVNPALSGTKVAAHYVAEIPAGGALEVRLRLTNALAPDGRTPWRTSTSSWLLPARGRHVLREGHPARPPRGRPQRHAAGLRRDALDQAVLPLPRRRLARRRPGTSTRRERASIATSTGSTSSAPTSSRCPISGSTRGSPPGTSPSTPSCSRASTPTSPSSRWGSWLRQYYIHPNGQLPAYEWNFSDVNPPVHATATWQVYLLDKAIRKRTAFSKRSFKSCSSTSPGGSTARTARGRTSSEGGFLGLDNIGVFDRSKPCRRAATSSRPTGRAGWRSSRSRC